MDTNDPQSTRPEAEQTPLFPTGAELQQQQLLDPHAEPTEPAERPLEVIRFRVAPLEERVIIDGYDGGLIVTEGLSAYRDEFIVTAHTPTGDDVRCASTLEAVGVLMDVHREAMRDHGAE